MPHISAPKVTKIESNTSYRIVKEKIYNTIHLPISFASRKYQIRKGFSTVIMDCYKISNYYAGPLR